VGQFEIDTAKLTVNENLKKIGKIWKELDQTKRIRPTRIFSNDLFRSYNSFKMTCLKINVKTTAFFVTCNFRF
jgi:hypothetical protein